MEQRKQAITLTVLMLAAGAIWFYQQRSFATRQSEAHTQNYSSLDFPNPAIALWKLDNRRAAAYVRQGSDLTSYGERNSPSHSRPTTTTKPHESDRVSEPILPPALSLRFFGYGNVPVNTARRAFLQEGDDIYIVSEGEIILGRFRILKINNSNLEFEEVGSGRRGQKLLEDQGPAA